ncbi:MAG TPA: hypothetical protein VED59_09555 [Acidimicrobiales bacterium]|nr:hypothetical protein [Acidimicrobiales bacterium]
MCESLSELHEAFHAYTAGFDAGLVAPAELGFALACAGAIEKAAAALSSLLAARMASGAGLRATSAGCSAERQAAEALAKAVGTSVSEARRAIDAGRTMTAQPALAAAGLGGELSRDQTVLVAGAASANPTTAPRLLEIARTSSLSELSEHCGRVRAEVEDLEARRRALYARRTLRSWTDTYGAWHLAAQGLAEQGALIMTAIRPLADEAFEAARAEGRRESPEAYAFDGLVALSSSGGPKARPGYEVMVRVDLPALLRGYPLGGEECEIAGFGPVPASFVSDIANSGSAFLKAILTKSKDVVGVAHLGRRPNAYQRSALDWLFPTCAAEGCGVRASFLESDHQVPWATNHLTLLELLDRLCRHHHRLKTHQGWELVPGRGKRPFVAPDDPRHPRFAPRK